MRASLAWLLFALGAAIPSVAVLVVALRAASTESARAREEQFAERVAAAQATKRDVDAALARATETLRRLEPAAVSRLESRLMAEKPDFADVVVIGAEGQMLVPKPMTDEPPSPPECLTHRAELLEGDRTAARDGIIGACPHLKSEQGRYLWPLLALERVAEGSTPADAVATWIEEHAARLGPAERSVLRARVAPLPEKVRDAALGALDRPLPLHRTLAGLLTEPPGSDSVEAGLRIHRGRYLSLVRTMPEGIDAGFVVHESSMIRAPGLPAHLVLAAGARGDATDVVLTPSLVLHVEPKDGASLDAEARRSGRRILAVGVAGVLTAVALATVLFARARKAQRLAELRTDFVAAVSHELRTPLASVRMLSELLETGELPDDERPEVERTLAGEARRLSDTVERMLRFGALARGRLSVQKSRVPASCILEDARDRFHKAHPDKGIVVDAPPSLEMHVDPGLVGLVLDNLLSNAAKYAAEGHPYRVEVRRDGRHALLSVSDSGPGIAARARRRIFSPFERADDRLSRATEGTGVGLSLVRGVARAHGGDAFVKSTVGAGSTFVVRFPLEGS
ncbi:HAMP domain-containing histidine kinase [Pendulispora brunnea]|uniref:histidine kinase n=1 Tax=Pendulispora brunnea TaxID=2905690 RepID=A0ABZ2K889_9BACT